MAQQGEEPPHPTTGEAHAPGSPGAAATDSGVDVGSLHGSYDQDNHGNNLLQAHTESDDVSTDEGYARVDL